MRRQLGSWALVSALSLVGCAEGPASSSSGAPVVYGDDDRLEQYAHPDPILRARGLESTVALIRPERLDTTNPGRIVVDHRTLGDDEDLCPGEPFFDQQVGASCSGTLVDWDLVLTAGHCVDDFAECQSRWFVFDHLYEAEGRLATIGPQDVFRCRRIVARRDFGGVDYAFVQLDRPAAPPRWPAPVDRSGLPLTVGSSVAVIGFPDGIPMKLDSGGVVIDDGAPEFEAFEATLDTFGGNSGSGVYNPAREVVGVLSNGETDYVRQGACWVVNRLPAEGDQGDAEGVSAVGPALEGLCRSGWRSELCGPGGGACRPCANDAVCPEGWSCRSAAADPGITWCAAPCAQDADCPADHRCVASACDPALETTCLGQSVWSENACGRLVEAVEACAGPFETCVGGACRPAAPGNGCPDPVVVPAIDQVLTGSVGAGLSDESQGSCGGAGAERVFGIEVTAPTRLVATAEGYDTVLYLRSQCDAPATERACSDDDDPPGERGSRIALTLAPGRSFLFLDAYGARTGDYVLTLDFTELSPPDSGVRPDTGAWPDAAPEADAEVEIDAGVEPPAPDAGVVIDAGEAPPLESGGCACAAPGRGAAPLGLLALFALRRRRTRRARP